MVEKRYPYQPGEFGIPFSQLSMGTTTTIHSGSGALLECQFYPSVIRIADYSTNGELYAKVSGEEMVATLRTKQKNAPQRHPDLYAKKFLRFALQHFADNGYTINGFRGKWSEGSDNYSAFWENYKTGGDKIAAVKHTWTGRAMYELGFTKLTESSLWIEEDRVIALFQKE